MKTPVELILAIANIGGRVAAVGDRLKMLLPRDCSPDLKHEVQQQKPAMLKLMRLTFLIVRSAVLDATVFFVPDKATKRSLLLAGADPGSIYTKAELGTLVTRRVTPNELRFVHEINNSLMER